MKRKLSSSSMVRSLSESSTKKQKLGYLPDAVRNLISVKSGETELDWSYLNFAGFSAPWEDFDESIAHTKRFHVLDRENRSETIEKERFFENSNAFF